MTHLNRSTGLLLMAAYLLVGGTLGVFTGLSESPVVGVLVQAIIGVPAAVVAYLLAAQTGAPAPGGETSARSRTFALRQVAILCIMLSVGLLGGTWTGISLRLRWSVQPTPESTLQRCPDTWPPDYCAHALMQDRLLDEIGVDEEAQRSWREGMIQQSAPMVLWEEREGEEDGPPRYQDTTHSMLEIAESLVKSRPREYQPALKSAAR